MSSHFPVPFKSLASHKRPLKHCLVPRAGHQDRLGCISRRSKRLLGSRERQFLVERIQEHVQILWIALSSALRGARDTHLVDL